MERIVERNRRYLSTLSSEKERELRRLAGENDL